MRWPIFHVLEESLLSGIINTGAGKTLTFFQVYFLGVKIEQNLWAGHVGTYVYNVTWVCL